MAPVTRRRLVPPPNRTRRKPAWVRSALIRLAALNGASSRILVNHFNRLYAARGVSVGKTYVAETLRVHRAQIAQLRRRYKHRVPPPIPCNQVWGLDLTGKGDAAGQRHPILGVIDHGSRLALCLQPLRDKTAITLLRGLLDAVERFGKPRTIRTDNEAVFRSRLFRNGLARLGIRQQFSRPGCPWQNGRIERLFGTLKQKLDLLAVPDFAVLEHALREFRLWYNQVRPHQHLHGWTPAEAWQGIDPYRTPPRQVRCFSAWEGLLTGFHLRR